ncbi:phospho-N-acetylmuramoyl-pentapeptide-transferase [candidate division WOR-3 bacterium RBG_13_43_14]|uniref:Phospho-N-acetylmuramoyl-pentapeptide-transferase n=1 Tax=candidate division WOR-3 bacterium RBG_13_43_14 TaxID=1802590 RepID=A0A1F4U8T9_UNCW3|nr:MAG: phospho-N-acetylmuramoyl-pentapeptide-transferase [candidate division WOR-3 bacterium RBG_13_43_14]
MLYLLLYPLRDYFGPFRLFGYITFRSAYAVVAAILVVMIFGRRFIRFMQERSIGQRIRDEVPESHRKKAGTPSMGGLMILAAILIAALLFCDLTNPNILILLSATLWFGVLGAYDDYVKIYKGKPRGLSIRTKLIWQLLYGISLGLFLYFLGPQDYITRTNLIFIKNYIINLGVLYPLFVTLVVVGSSNGVNLTDGLDGLAIGLIAIAALAYSGLAYAAGHIVISNYLDVIFIKNGGEVTVFCASILGASLGFLWYNTYPAQVFMGDTGALSLGAIIGTAAILIKQEILLIIVGGVFVVEVLSVILQVVYFRKTGGRRLFRMAPIHHHFELKGLMEPKVVVRFWIIGIILLMIALSTLKIR